MAKPGTAGGKRQKPEKETKKQKQPRLKDSPPSSALRRREKKASSSKEKKSPAQGVSKGHDFGNVLPSDPPGRVYKVLTAELQQKICQDLGSRASYGGSWLDALRHWKNKLELTSQEPAYLWLKEKGRRWDWKERRKRSRPITDQEEQAQPPPRIILKDIACQTDCWVDRDNLLHVPAQDLTEFEGDFERVLSSVGSLVKAMEQQSRASRKRNPDKEVKRVALAISTCRDFIAANDSFYLKRSR